MNHDSLKLFLHLAQTLHFGNTSRACHISPSALSRQIQRMETAVGEKLFERDNRRVSLTPSGRRFGRYARETLENWQHMLEELSQQKTTLQGEIRIYCSVTASLGILPDLLGAFRKSYPQVRIRLQTGDAAVAVQKVAGGDADVAVSALPDRLPETLAFTILTRVSLVFVAPAADWEFSAAIDGRVAWEQIPFILSASGLARQRVDAWFRKKGIQPNIYAQVSGNEAILAMVNLGCGVGIVPQLAIANSPLRNRIAVLDVRPPLAPYQVGICIHRRRMASRLMTAFWETAQHIQT